MRRRCGLLLLLGLLGWQALVWAQGITFGRATSPILTATTACDLDHPTAAPGSFCIAPSEATPAWQLYRCDSDCTQPWSQIGPLPVPTTTDEACKAGNCDIELLNIGDTSRIWIGARGASARFEFLNDGTGSPKFKCYDADQVTPCTREILLESGQSSMISAILNSTPVTIKTIQNVGGTLIEETPSPTVCTVLNEVVAADDNIPFEFNALHNYRVTHVGCRYHGAAPTQQANFVWRNTTGDMTHAAPTCAAPTAAIAWTAVTANGGELMTAGTTPRISVGNTPNPLTDNYGVCFRYQWRP